MPRYDYTCKDCKKDFFIICSISDNRDNIKCDKCNSINISRIFNAIILKHNKEENNSKEVKKASVINNSCNHDHAYGSHCCPEDEYL
ncbi:MAG: FmdB family zinc ribbon protein [Candidatus Sericytochromatia bacterium]